MKVSHRDRDALYPIAVDPTFVLENWIHRNGDYSANWQTDPNLDFLGWAPTTLDGAPEFQQGYGAGLMVAFNPGEPGDGEWRWRPPGNARVFRAEYAAYSYWGPYGDCAQEGIKSSNGGWADTLNGAPDQPLQPSAHPCDGPGGYQIYCLRAQPCGSAGGAPGDFAVFGASRSEYSEYRAETNLPGAAVFVADHDRPYFTQADVWENLLEDRNWSFEQDQAYWAPLWADAGTYTLPPRVHGERHYSIRRRAGEGIDGYALASTGAVPAEAGRSYRASFSARPEAGVRPALARAELFFLNAAGQELARQFGPWARETSAPDWRRVPEVSAQAPAGTASVAMHMAWSETLDGQWHNADAAMLEAVCDGGCANRWTKSARRYVNTVATDDGLGAKRTRLSHATRAGGTATDYRTHPCAGNRFDYCPAPYNRDGVGYNQTFQVNTDDLPEGTVPLDTFSTDVTDNDSTRADLPPMKIDRTVPEPPSLSGYLVDAAPRLYSGVEYDAQASAVDTVSGLASLELQRDGVTVAKAECGGQQRCVGELSYTPPDSDAGNRTIAVVARDLAGNFTVGQQVAVGVDATGTDETQHDAPESDIMSSEELPNDDPDVPNDNPNGYCGPASAYPEQPCDDSTQRSSIERAAAGEPSLLSSAETPLMVGQRSAPSPGTGDDLSQNGSGWGLSDEKPSLFTAKAPGGGGTAINDLSVSRVRKIIAFDAVARASSDRTYPAIESSSCGMSGTVTVPKNSGDEKELDRWFDALVKAETKSRNYEPMISFQLSKGPVGSRVRCALPTVEQYHFSVVRVLERYRLRRGGKGAVRVMTAWNEPNAGSQPTRTDEGMRRAGQYYAELRKICRDPKYDCLAVAGDFLDTPNFTKRVPLYKQGIASRSEDAPQVWALHPYYTAARVPTAVRREERLDNFIRVAMGSSNSAKLWITESGGLYDGNGETIAKRNLCRSIDLARSRPSRVTRYYHYELLGARPGEAFDTGLLDFAGVERPLYDVFAYRSAGAGSNPC